MTIKRDFYVDKLMSVRHNGLVKVVTGVRRCGKSYLLFNLYRDALKAEGVGDDQFVCVVPFLVDTSLPKSFVLCVIWRKIKSSSTKHTKV